ncbi:MAG: stage II sporulation protein D [Oscillospiraceae bacterium]|jgi:stage II sporulation protein D|nr:stage II sporulation protein D [Oscillospiraceae bacterium]
MKKVALVSLALGVFAAALSVVSALMLPMKGASGADSPPGGDVSIPQETRAPITQPQPGEADARVSVRVKDGETVREMSMFEYLVGAVAGEMPASFEPEALRAQAAAARTYVWYNISVAEPKKHENADVCTDSTCCAAFSSDETLREKWGAEYEQNLAKLRAAVADTDGIFITYDSQPILAAFHASSYGSTESAADVWQGAKPYLISVPSPETEEDAPGLISAVTISLKDFKETASKALPDAVFGDDAGTWITDITYDDAGRVASLKIGGVKMTGAGVRAMLGLRSTAVTIQISSDGAAGSEGSGNIVFTTAGYGHGVGMSQYGANVMAKNGSGWRDIIKAYYTGAALSDEPLAGLFANAVTLSLSEAPPKPHTLRQIAPRDGSSPRR